MSLDMSRRLRLSKHADLKTRREGDILVLPERAIRIGGSGGEILRLVVEGETETSVLATMRNRYPGTSSIDAQVRDFLAQMLEIGGIVQVDAPRKTSQ